MAAEVRMDWRAEVSSVVPSPLAPAVRTDLNDGRGRVLY